MVDKVTVPAARASILWLIGEYSERISKLAPDVLRKMAKTFPDEVSVPSLGNEGRISSSLIGNHCEASNSELGGETLCCERETDAPLGSVRLQYGQVRYQL